MKRVFLFLIVGVMMSTHLPAQNPGQEFTNKMNHIFQHVNKSKIATGLLYDYGLQIVEPEYFNGVPMDSNFVIMETWRMLYTGLFTSQINGIIMTDPETVFAQVDNAGHATAVPLAMMHYLYNAINQNSPHWTVNMSTEQLLEPALSPSASLGINSVEVSTSVPM